MASAGQLSGNTNTQVSTQVFVTALVTGLIFAGVYLAIFLVVRTRFRKIYQPRSYLVELRKQAEPLPSGFFAWFPAILRADARQIIQKSGLDAYVFVRFLFLMIEIFLPFTVVTWVILLPIDAANSGGTNTGVARFTFGNVGLSQQPRYAAHLIITWLLTFYVLYLIKRELAAFVVLRQDFLLTREHVRLPQSKTVLVTGVPREYLNVKSLTQFCSVLPGGVQRIWFARDLGDLPDLYDRRDKALNKLESAENKLLKLASKAMLKEKKQSMKNGSGPTDVEADQSQISRWVPAKKRPSHKLGFLGLVGKKVDTIEWAREEISTCNKELDNARQVVQGSDADSSYPPESAAFIQFNQQMAAHMFAQCLAHHAPLRMSSRYIDVAQEDVIWSNLSISPYQAKGRYVLSWLATIGLIVLWSFPVAFVGLISNVTALCARASWLAWLCKLPTPVNGIIQGSLPPIALAVLFILLPIILRLFARFQGIPLRTQIELSLMTRYFIFQVIHGFLIVTLASGLVAAIPQITQNPSSAVKLLATKLPAASTFFLTYFVTTSIAGAAANLAQVVPLIVYYVKLFILGSTPRSVYGIKYNMGSPAWGTLFPNMTLLTVIGLVYSVIAPLVSGFAMLAFALFWFVYKYLFIWVYDPPVYGETGGLFYPKALSHILVGLYIEQICLAGLFFLAQDRNDNQSAIPEGALMVVLIVITILFQITMNSGYKPLIAYLPLSVAARVEEVERSSGLNSAPQTRDEKNTFPPGPRKSEDGRGLIDGERKSNLYEGQSEEEKFGSIHAFDHPATYQEQRTVWIPQDRAGLYREEEAATAASEIKVSSEGAFMDEKGSVTVKRSPPDEPWNEDQEI